MKKPPVGLVDVALIRTLPKMSAGVNQLVPPRSMPPLVMAYDGVANVWVSLFRKPAESRWLLVAQVAAPAAARMPSAISPSTHPMIKDVTRPPVHPRRRVGGAGGGPVGEGGATVDGAAAVGGGGAGIGSGCGAVSAIATSGLTGPVGGSGTVIVPAGSGPPMSSLNGGYLSVINPAYAATRSTHRF